ncbi:hypothetical protein ACWU4D_04375 [Vibrio sp. WJH972]
MSGGQDNVVWVILIGLVLVVVSWIARSENEKKLSDPNDNTVIDLDDLTHVSTLQPNGKYLVRLLRQSGNLQKEDQIFDSHIGAIKAAVTTFKRAKIEFACINRNTEVEFFFQRPYHHHGGKAEGKKVGRVEIYKIE